MKNLFTYKNNIASGLKRYGKFLLLAISLLFLSNTAWAAAPTEMWLRYNIKSSGDSYEHSDMKWTQMEKISDTQWHIELTLNNSDNNFYFGTGNTYAQLISSNINIVVTDKPACVTRTQTGDYGASAGNKRKLYLGSSNGANCKIAFTVNYVEGDNNPYQISLISGCDDAVPTVTTGTMTVDANKFFVVNDNELVDLGANCNVDLAYQIKGVEITTNKEGSKDRYTTVTSGATGSTLGVYTITATGVQPQNNTTYWYRAYAINNTSAGIGNDGVGYGEWKSFNLSIPGTTPSIRIGKQPVVSNLTDVAMNFQIADWGCTTVKTVKVYYTRTDIGEDNTTEPTTSSDLWEFTTAIDNNGNITLSKEDLPSGNYNIKAVACNTSGCGDLSDMASFTITACEKPAQPSVQNTNRTNCSDLLITFNIAVGNKALITINEGTGTTTVAPQDGQTYTAAVAPAGITIQDINYEGAIVKATIKGLDGHKQYTVTCYQYVEATHCYSAPITSVIEKVAPEIAVEMTEITTKTATVTITLTGTGINVVRVTEYQGENRIAGPFDIQQTFTENVATYNMSTRLQDGTDYKLLVEAIDNKDCQTTEVVEFTTMTCPTLTLQTVTGVNTTGKVQATITMASSQTNAEYQLYIEDTPIDGTLQDGTGSALTWQVNQTGLYYIKGWFKEAPYYCTNAPTIMGEYNLDCVQAATPVISIDKNVICSNDAVGATISVNQVDGVSYTLYKNGEEQNNTLTDGKFTGLTAAGNYTVVATENKCQTTATSQIVTLTVIDASASVTINPTTDTTTPWVPVNFTVTSTAGAPYTLVYKDAAGNDVTDQMVVVKKGNSYSLKIPRPSTWAKGNSTDPVATTTYTVEASLEGQASCGSTSTLIITLNDTFEICE